MATSDRRESDGSSDAAGPILYPLATVLLILSLLFGFAFLPKLFSDRTAIAGKPAGDFEVDVVANSPDKPTLALRDLRGKVVVLDFWATWCGPCQAQSPVLDGLATRFRDRGLVVVGMNTNDEEGNAKRWAASHGVVYPIVYDDGNKVAHEYNVESFPTLVIIDREGKIVARRIGITSANELEGLVKKIL